MIALRSSLGLARKPFASLIRSTAVRSLSTISTTHEKEQEILVAQRKNRPSSPHLTIYQPQLTWYMSSVHRVGGILLAFAFYGVTVSYALASATGLHLDSQVIADAFHSLSPLTQFSLKSIPGFLFFYHAANGVRHLVWDAGKELTLKGVYRTGYAVIAFSTVATAIYAAFF